jgi:hypothetical protein
VVPFHPGGGGAAAGQARGAAVGGGFGGIGYGAQSPGQSQMSRGPLQPGHELATANGAGLNAVRALRQQRPVPSLNMSGLGAGTGAGAPVPPTGPYGHLAGQLTAAQPAMYGQPMQGRVLPRQTARGGAAPVQVADPRNVPFSGPNGFSRVEGMRYNDGVGGVKAKRPGISVSEPPGGRSNFKLI